jgi:hypothetical protein
MTNCERGVAIGAVIGMEGRNAVFDITIHDDDVKCNGAGLLRLIIIYFTRWTKRKNNGKKILWAGNINNNTVIKVILILLL